MKKKPNIEEKTFTVTFHDWFQAETEDEAFDKILEYLRNCVVNKDLTGFGIEEKDDYTYRPEERHWVTFSDGGRDSLIG